MLLSRCCWRRHAQLHRLRCVVQQQPQQQHPQCATLSSAAAAQPVEVVLLLGPAGSGKGTQARLLEERGCPMLDWGQARRAAVEAGTAAGQRVAALGDLVSRGKFIDNDTATCVFVEALQALVAKNNKHEHHQRPLILDGYPRNVEQLSFIRSTRCPIPLRLKMVLVLHAPFEVLLQRTDGRLIHKASGRTYHAVECPPVTPGADDVTGEPLQPRLLSTTMAPDAALRARCAIEEREIGPLVAQLEAAAPSTRVVHIDKGRSPAWFKQHRRHPRQLHTHLVETLHSHGLLRAFSTTREQPPMKAVAIVGLGPHARRIYHPILQRSCVTIPLVVDLEGCRGAVEAHLLATQHQGAAVERTMFVPDACKHDRLVHTPVREALDALVASNQLDGLIIASEPSSHEPYLRWALERGVDVLVDKPPTIPAPFAADRIVEQFESVASLAASSPSTAVACVQRRAHPGYRLVHRILSDTVAQYGVPISFLDIYHADGMWCMPGELATRDAHPYKYGYGKLVHSGYHGVDLCVWLQAINDEHLLGSKAANGGAVDISARAFAPDDLLHQLSAQDLMALTGASEADVSASMHDYVTRSTSSTSPRLGELNVHALIQFLRGPSNGGDDRPGVVCTASLNLLQNSFSRRGWFHPKPDVYKGNGRVRHERLVANVGTLCSVHVHSYQSHEVGQPDTLGAAPSASTSALLQEEGLSLPAAAAAAPHPPPSPVPYGPGHEDHFDVYVYRNTAVCKGPEFEHIPVGAMVAEQQAESEEPHLGHNEYARARLVRDWIQRSTSSVAPPLQEQAATMRMLAQLYQALATAQ